LIAYEERFRAILKPMGLLTRDSRVVERKKPGKKQGKKKSSVLKNDNIPYLLIGDIST